MSTISMKLELKKAYRYHKKAIKIGNKIIKLMEKRTIQIEKFNSIYKEIVKKYSSELSQNP